MTTPNHFQTSSPIPVYAVAIPRSDVVLYAGGGGQSRSGVSNAIRSASIELGKRRLLDRTEIKLSNEEDAPMCLAVSCRDQSEEPITQEQAERVGLKNVNIGPSHRKLVAGINSSLTQSGINENLRLFDWTSSGYKPSSVVSIVERATDMVKEQVKDDEAGVDTRVEDVQAIQSTRKAQSVIVRDLEQYVRVTVISPDNRYLAVGSTDGQIALHALPSLEKIWLATPVPSSEVIDATFSSDSALVAFILPTTILIYSTSSALSRGESPEAFQTIRNPVLKGTSGCVFRAAKFGRSSGKGIGRSDRLYTVVNSNPPSDLGSSKKDREKARTRKCFVSMWDADKWTVLKTTRISDRPSTVLALSDNGKHLAISTSDLVIHLLSASTLLTIWRLKEAHAFPSTCLAFSPNGNVLISGSADMSLRVMEVGAAEEPATLQIILESKTLTLLLALVLALVAFYVQQRIAPSLPRVMDIQ